MTLTTGTVEGRAYLLESPRVNRRFSDLAEETSFHKEEVPNPVQTVAWKLHSLIVNFILHSLISRGGICRAGKIRSKRKPQVLVEKLKKKTRSMAIEVGTIVVAESKKKMRNEIIIWAYLPIKL